LEEQANVTTHKCPTCRAEMAFDPARQQLHCEHCGTTTDVPRQGTVAEHDLWQGLAESARRGLGTPVRTTRCQECGATVSFSQSVTSTECDFCGSSQVLAQEENRQLIRPESVVPFNVDGKQAAVRFREWLKGLWFRPSDLKARANVTELNGVYVPYWTFDAMVDSSWTADAGYYYYETEEYTETDDKGNTQVKTRQVRLVRWEPASGARHDRYDDLLVCASRGLPEALARKLSSFDTAGLKPYDPAYLAGWKAEEYAIDLKQAWQQAQATIESTQQNRCSSDVPGDTHRSLRVSNRFGDETFKHVLLPLWISAFRYGSKVYRFLVNGQTGEVVGKAPWSAAKLALFIGSIAALVALIIILVKVLR